MQFFSADSRVYIDPKEEMKRYISKLKKIQKFPVPRKLIYTPLLIKPLQEKIKENTKFILPDLYPGKSLYWLEHDILYYEGFMGAPVTINFLEELIALGVTDILFLGLAGGIQNTNIGQNFLVKSAVRREGTSYHYFPDNFASEPSELLLANFSYYLSKNKIKMSPCSICSTDAPFRETFELINELRSQNISGIEMEISAVYSLAKFRKVNALALITMSDLLENDKWSHFQPQTFLNNFLELLDIGIDFFKTF